MKLTFLAVLATLTIPPMLLSADIFYAQYSNTWSTTNVSSIGSSADCDEFANISARSLERLVDAIAVAESASDTDRTGDQGKAAGRWQLHKGAVHHVNQRFKKKYIWPQDALTPTTAREIVKFYLVICGYGKRSTEETARRYNGGYKHWQSKQAGEYWRKVERALK